MIIVLVKIVKSQKTKQKSTIFYASFFVITVNFHDRSNSPIQNLLTVPLP